jgi:hypothetical protein
MEQLDFFWKNSREILYKRKLKFGYNRTKDSVLPVNRRNDGKGAVRIIKEQGQSKTYTWSSYEQQQYKNLNEIHLYLIHIHV